MTLQAGALSNRHGGSIGMPVADLGGSTSGTPSSGDSTPPATDSGTNTGGSTTPSDGTSSGTTPVAPLADGALVIAGLLDNDGGHITPTRVLTSPPTVASPTTAANSNCASSR